MVGFRFDFLLLLRDRLFATMDNGRPPLKEEQGDGFRSVPIYADGYR